MAYIIDETYFQREYYVPNVDELNSEAYNELTQFIDGKARLLIKDALGYELFKEFDSYVTSGNLSETAPQKWINLVDGVEYELNGETYYWNGLKRIEGAFRSSLITPFVFYHWLESRQSVMTGVGEVVVNSKNAVNVNGNQRLTKTWNDFVSQYQETDKHEYNPNIFYQRGVRVVDWLSDRDGDFVSLIKFISDNSEDYQNAALKRYKFKNQLGL